MPSATSTWLREYESKRAAKAVSKPNLYLEVAKAICEPMIEGQQNFTIWVTPMGKPRMTRRDKWAKRPCVQRYWAYKEALKAGCVGVHPRPLSVSWRVWFPLPKSWNKFKKATLAGKLHRYKPDRDNIDKGILDALWKDDSGIADGGMSKFWDDGNGARIELTVMP